MKNTSRKPYIYKVTNLETGQYYIGSQCIGKIVGMNYFTSSTNKEFEDDFKTHREKKYKIEIIRAFEDPDECVRVENYMISDQMQLKDGLCLNRACCCSGKKVFSRVGIPQSEEAKEKISRAKKGRPARNKGIPQSEEAKEKISRAKKGIHPSEETRKKLSEAHKGTHHSEEARQKMSISKKGRLASNRIKISIEGTVFDSITEASKYYNVVIETIRNWVKKNQHNAVYIEK